MANSLAERRFQSKGPRSKSCGHPRAFLSCGGATPVRRSPAWRGKRCENEADARVDDALRARTCGKRNWRLKMRSWRHETRSGSCFCSKASPIAFSRDFGPAQAACDMCFSFVGFTTKPFLGVDGAGVRKRWFAFFSLNSRFASKD